MPRYSYAAPGMINGLQIITSELVGDAYEDWSGVRSPARARRRRKLGHPQRIVTRYRANGTVLHDQVNNCVVMHPADRLKLEAALKETT